MTNEELLNIIKRKGLKVSQVAILLSITPKQVYNYLNGVTKITPLRAAGIKSKLNEK